MYSAVKMAHKETGRHIIEKQSETIVEIDKNGNDEQNSKTIITMMNG